jgi:hypothetical protein
LVETRSLEQPAHIVDTDRLREPTRRTWRLDLNCRVSISPAFTTREAVEPTNRNECASSGGGREGLPVAVTFAERSEVLGNGGFAHSPEVLVTALREVPDITPKVSAVGRQRVSSGAPLDG